MDWEWSEGVYAQAVHIMRWWPYISREVNSNDEWQLVFVSWRVFACLLLLARGEMTAAVIEARISNWRFDIMIMLFRCWWVFLMMEM